MSQRSDELQAALRLLSARAVRERAHMILTKAERGTLKYFTVDSDRLPSLANDVADLTRRRYLIIKSPSMLVGANSPHTDAIDGQNLLLCGQPGVMRKNKRAPRSISLLFRCWCVSRLDSARPTSH